MTLRCKNAANSFSEGVAELSLSRRGYAGADPGIGPGRGVAVTHQLHEFLRRRFMTALAALLRHRATNPVPFLFCRNCLLAPRRGSDAACSRPLGTLAGLARRGLLANIDVVIAHDQDPLLRLDHNAQPPGKVAAFGQTVSPAPMFRFTPLQKASPPEKG